MVCPIQIVHTYHQLTIALSNSWGYSTPVNAEIHFLHHSTTTTFTRHIFKHVIIKAAEKHLQTQTNCFKITHTEWVILWCCSTTIRMQTFDHFFEFFVALFYWVRHIMRSIFFCVHFGRSIESCATRVVFLNAVVW